MFQILIIIILSIVLYNLIDPKSKKTITKIKSSKIKINEKLFMTREETQEFLRADEDNFVNNLDTINKKARGVNNIYVYLDRITESATNFKKEDKVLLQESMNKAEKLMLNTKSKKLKEYGINIERLKMLRGFRLALTRGKVYLEKNRDKPEKVLRTLIHEIVHIYQRNNGRIYDEFLKEEFWTIVLKPKNIERRRMNPDLDLDIWEKDGRVYMAKFTSDNPKSLDDIDINGESQYEHPYEYYAYRFSNEILNNFI